ncbi:putative uncharacterized protein [Blautia hydrogenotrophica CAG:147]|uniref:LysR family transcriptional regulator n=1 Tax=Blautia hydrogenotrophica TaxID=53443 RepID=UPI0003375ED0|nr:LysR family transcriptional regulator [Blautia hydrogenotrophica]CCX59964.1 putative uncharacterized protein [Blautia hydrogenotrophica CAG:147]SCH57205.1 HTH-type transcriptional regulator YofA [uncultured Blautia sp.]
MIGSKPAKTLFYTSNSQFCPYISATPIHVKRNPIKTILEIGSFQKAAEHLNYAQSTVTPQMLQLEQEFSIKLFEKIGRIMKLTQAGKGLIPYIDNVIEVVQQMESYGKENQELTGTLRIADSETLLACQMPQILKNFCQDGTKWNCP